MKSRVKSSDNASRYRSAVAKAKTGDDCQSDDARQSLRPWFCKVGVLVLMILSVPVALAQTQQANIQGGPRVDAENKFKEGQALRAQRTPEARKSAIEKYQESLTLFRSIGDRAAESRVLYVIGVTYSESRDPRKAIEFYKQALILVRALANRKNEAVTLASLGLAFDESGDRKQALDHHLQALPIQRELGDHVSELATLLRIGDDYNSLKQQQKALDFFNQAVTVARQVGDRRAEALSLHDMATAYDVLGEKQKALENYNLALPIWRTIADKSSEASTLMGIGIVNDSLGDKHTAVGFYEQALIAAKQGKDSNLERATLFALGIAYNFVGEKQKALETYNQLLTIAKTAGDRSAEADALLKIGNVYNSLGDADKGLEYYERVLLIQRELRDLSGEATTLNNMGTVYIRFDKPKALEYFNNALAKLVEVNSLRAAILNNIGGVYDLQGDKQKALSYYRQALPMAQKLNDRLQEARTLDRIAVIYDSTGDRTNALELFSQALALEAALGDHRGEVNTLAGLMLFWKKSDPACAAFQGKLAVNVFESLRANIKGVDKELQRSFIRSNEGTYRILADLLLSSGRLAEAQEVLNLFKDQQFFDFNSGVQSQPALVTFTAKEAAAAHRFELAAKRVENAAKPLDELRIRIGQNQPSPSDANTLNELQQQLSAALKEFLAALKLSESEFAVVDPVKDRVTDIADTRNLQRVLTDLSKQKGHKAVAIYTLVGEDNLRTLLITPDNLFTASQEIKAVDVNDKAEQLWGLLQTDKYDPATLSHELYDIIFKPIESQLPKDTDTILWSLDGKLRYLPMAALYDGSQYLVQRFNHVVFTRADAERMLRPVSQHWTGLGLASSKAQTVELLGDTIRFNALPGVNAEIKAVFKAQGSSDGIISGEVLPDAQFTEASMLAALKLKRPLVHISSHFSFRPGDEARSFLLLGDGGALTLEEMKQHPGLFSGVELLTLSACNTAAQQEANGREIDGFAELAQRLGAGSVLATLWPVSDNSTPWLMKEFYKTREAGTGITKADAMRLAQLSLLNGTAQAEPLPEAQKGPGTRVKIIVLPAGVKRDSQTRSVEALYISADNAPAYQRDQKHPFAHPYYWAPFILVGNSR